MSVIFPNDPSIWKTHLAPRGALKEAIRSGYTAPLPKYVTEEDKKELVDGLLKNWLKAPTRWYNVTMTNKAAEDSIKSAVPLYCVLSIWI